MTAEQQIAAEQERIHREKLAERDGACENCRFWNRPYERCQKRAPILVFSPEGQYGNDWGIAKSDDWCGEFEEKK